MKYSGVVVNQTEYTPRELDHAIRLSEGIFVKTSDKLLRICGFSFIYHARAHHSPEASGLLV
jgi:hypothetical protein